MHFSPRNNLYKPENSSLCPTKPPKLPPGNRHVDKFLEFPNRFTNRLALNSDRLMSYSLISFKIDTDKN